MVWYTEVSWNILCLILISIQTGAYIQRYKLNVETQDQTSSRPNTLFDDADDLQKQLDNEARDRLKMGKQKTLWVLHLPRPLPEINYLRTTRNLRSADQATVATLNNLKWGKNYSINSFDWDYNKQAEWGKHFPDCKGRSQSPVDLPAEGFIRAEGFRQLNFDSYDVRPENISVQNDGKHDQGSFSFVCMNIPVTLCGNWDREQRPLVYGGAAHSRRYVFHSLRLTWPSEHTIGGLRFPMEGQAIHISAEYTSLQEALHAAPRDPQALLGIVSLYKYANHTQRGLREILDAIITSDTFSASVQAHPLSFFVPAFKQYVSYQGSLTWPPCTESVLWLVRAKSLPVTRAAVEAAHRLLNPYNERSHYTVRMPQPLNDRKIFLFDPKK